MAVAGVTAGRTFLLVLGSGFAGAYVLENKAWVWQLLNITGKPVEENMDAVKQLSKNVEALASAANRRTLDSGQSSIKIVNTSDANSPVAKAWAVLAFAGGIFALFLYFRGRSVLSNLWVSRKSFVAAVNELEERIKGLTIDLNSVNSDLKSHMQLVEGHVSESAAEINLKLEEEIGLTKSRIDLVGTSVDEMQEFLRGIQAQVDKLQTNLQYANRGILMLCSIVGSLPQQEKRTRRLWDELRAFVRGTASTAGLEIPQSLDYPSGFAALEPTNPALSTRSRSLNYNIFIKDSLEYDGVSVRSFGSGKVTEKGEQGHSPPPASDRKRKGVFR